MEIQDLCAICFRASVSFLEGKASRHLTVILLLKPSTSFPLGVGKGLLLASLKQLTWPLLSLLVFSSLDWITVFHFNFLSNISSQRLPSMDSWISCSTKQLLRQLKVYSLSWLNVIIALSKQLWMTHIILTFSFYTDLCWHHGPLVSKTKII